MGISEVIDYRSAEFTIEEQQELASLKFLDVPRFQFLVDSAPHEGWLPTRLQRVSVAHYDAGQFPDDALVVIRFGRYHRRVHVLRADELSCPHSTL